MATAGASSRPATSGPIRITVVCALFSSPGGKRFALALARKGRISNHTPRLSMCKRNALLFGKQPRPRLAAPGTRSRRLRADPATSRAQSRSEQKIAPHAAPVRCRDDRCERRMIFAYRMPAQRVHVVLAALVRLTAPRGAAGDCPHAARQPCGAGSTAAVRPVWSAGWTEFSRPRVPWRGDRHRRPPWS